VRGLACARLKRAAIHASASATQPAADRAILIVRNGHYNSENNEVVELSDLHQNIWGIHVFAEIGIYHNR
jgi:hypothetical protein